MTFLLVLAIVAFVADFFGLDMEWGDYEFAPHWSSMGWAFVLVAVIAWLP